MSDPFAFDRQAFVGEAPAKPARKRRGPAVDGDAWECGADGGDPGRDGGAGEAQLPDEVDLATVAREFEAHEGHYQLRLPPLGITLAIDRLRRRSDELVGELTVHCALPGARTVDGVLSVGDLNLSSQRARLDRSRYLATRSRASLDWVGLIEEFAQRVVEAERRGQPAVLLRDLPRPRPDDVHMVDGLPLLARHPTILFGDGAAGKSYLALYAAGKLEQAGIRTAVFDWELAGEDHRDRLERLFGEAMPTVRYARCSRPFVHEVDRLRRIVREERLDFVVLDSIAFACDGAPENAETAGNYFRALRQLGTVGSLHVAHISKADGADQKPFGSAFWSNGARSTWFVKLVESRPGIVSIGLFNRKANLGAQRRPIGFEISFTEDRTFLRRVEVADVPDLAAGLSVRQRMGHLLRGGAMTAEAIAEELQADAETVKRTARRYPQAFTLLPGGKLGLLGTS